MDQTTRDSLFAPPTSMTWENNAINFSLDANLDVFEELLEERSKRKALEKELEIERRRRIHTERELESIKKFMFSDMPSDSMWNNVIVSDPIAAAAKSTRSPIDCDELRQGIVSEALDALGDTDILLNGDVDLMKDFDILSSRIFSSPDKNEKRDTSRHGFADVQDESHSVGTSIDPSKGNSLSQELDNGNPDDLLARRRSATPLKFEELELWLKCRNDFSTKWANQKTDFLEKCNFCHEQFMARWIKEVSNRFNAEDLYEYPIKCFIYHILVTRGPLPCGEIGKILKEFTQNNDIHLMPMIKVNYKGLKKFIELFSDLFHIGTEHPFNPTVYLVPQSSSSQPFPEHLLNDMGYVNEILQLGLSINRIENESVEKASPEDSAQPMINSVYPPSNHPYFETGSGLFHHRNASLSNDSTLSSINTSRSNSNSTYDVATGRNYSAEQRSDPLRYEGTAEPWSNSSSHFNSSTSSLYEKNHVNSGKYYSGRNVKKNNSSNNISGGAYPPSLPMEGTSNRTNKDGGMRSKSYEDGASSSLQRRKSNY